MNRQHQGEVAELFSKIEDQVRRIFADAVQTGRATIEVDLPDPDERGRSGGGRSGYLEAPPPDLHKIRVTPTDARSAALSVYTYHPNEVSFTVGSNGLWWDVWIRDSDEALSSVRDVAVAVRDGGYSELVSNRGKRSCGIKATFDSGIAGEEPKVVNWNWTAGGRGGVLVEYEPY